VEKLQVQEIERRKRVDSKWLHMFSWRYRETEIATSAMLDAVPTRWMALVTLRSGMNGYIAGLAASWENVPNTP
jgi:hypothetical protein